MDDSDVDILLEGGAVCQGPSRISSLLNHIRMSKCILMEKTKTGQVWAR